jgi:hypothetical protein
MARQKPKQADQQQSKSADKTTSLPQFILDEADTLQEMIEWWKSRESTAMGASERRPVFVGKTRNTGIRVNTEILDRAIKKAKDEKFKTGGNLSQLVEWLMWVYINSPLDVVENPNPPEQQIP